MKQFADFHALCDRITKALPIEMLQISLDGLQYITQFDGGIRISSNKGLRNVDELTPISDFAFLHLSANPALQHLEGLRFVKSNRGRMTITDHRVLESLGGLRSLERIDRVVNLEGCGM